MKRTAKCKIVVKPQLEMTAIPEIELSGVSRKRLKG